MYFRYSIQPGNDVLYIPGFVLYKSTNDQQKTPPFGGRLLSPDIYFWGPLLTNPVHGPFMGRVVARGS
jgi:hypothetical protein